MRRQQYLLVTKNACVVVRRITFPRSNDVTLVGNLLLPKQFDASRRYPAILCVHPAGSIKEQSAGLYAHLLASQESVTLAFDAPPMRGKAAKKHSFRKRRVNG